MVKPSKILRSGPSFLPEVMQSQTHLLYSQSLKPLWLPWSQNSPRFKGVVIPCMTLNWEFAGKDWSYAVASDSHGICLAFMSPSLMQHPSLGKQLRKHTFSMQGTSSSGGNAAPVTQQKNWPCALKQVVRSTHRNAQHPQHKQGAPVLQQRSHSRQRRVFCAAHPIWCTSGTQPS